jgi:hypothetical protein
MISGSSEGRRTRCLKKRNKYATIASKAPQKRKVTAMQKRSAKENQDGFVAHQDSSRRQLVAGTAFIMKRIARNRETG